LDCLAGAVHSGSGAVGALDRFGGAVQHGSGPSLFSRCVGAVPVDPAAGPDQARTDHVRPARAGADRIRDGRHAAAGAGARAERYKVAGAGAERYKAAETGVDAPAEPRADLPLTGSARSAQPCDPSATS
jgi:hypothetical protein